MSVVVIRNERDKMPPLGFDNQSNDKHMEQKAPKVSARALQYVDVVASSKCTIARVFKIGCGRVPRKSTNLHITERASPSPKACPSASLLSSLFC